MTGDCEVVDNCVSSTNYPNPHENNEACTITIEAPTVYLNVGEVFDLEKCCDHLVFPGDTGDVDQYYYDEEHHARDNVPNQMYAGEEINWSTDSSVAHNGWQICFLEGDIGNHQIFQ